GLSGRTGAGEAGGVRRRVSVRAAARALASDLPRAASSGRIAICISDAAAIPLRPFDFTQIRIAAAPDEPAMLSALGKPAAPV
ncbi:hypothetical protein, partial [Brevundimonas diminuta]|uniref:hypothetical protein n=1 Tax=Brevundimonas diminuta TaxID=293 RepID=UPI003AF0655C